MSIAEYGKETPPTGLQLAHASAPLRPERRLRILMCLLLAGVIAGAAFSAQAQPLPTPFYAQYDLMMGRSKIGETSRSLTRDARGVYVYESFTRASGMWRWFIKDKIVERSEWTYADTVLRPLTYLYDRHGGTKADRIELRFDWNDHVVINVTDGEAWKTPLLDGAQDRLIYQLSLMYDLQRKQRNMSYSIADKNRFKTYEFKVVGREEIDTPIGRLTAVVAKRTNDDRNITLWCAEQLGYLPVVIEQPDNKGNEFRLVIQAMEGMAIEPAQGAASGPR